MSYKLFQVRRGTPEEWRISNPILAAGEFGWERSVPLQTDPSADSYSYSDNSFDSGTLKIGDGVTRWNDLPYLLTSIRASFAGMAEIQVTDVKTGDVLRYADGKWRNQPEAQLFDGGNF